METIVFDFVLKLVGIGLGYYLVQSIFSKKTKDFHVSIDQNGVKVDSTFYKK